METDPYGSIPGPAGFVGSLLDLPWWTTLSFALLSCLMGYLATLARMRIQRHIELQGDGDKVDEAGEISWLETVTSFRSSLLACRLTALIFLICGSWFLFLTSVALFSPSTSYSALGLIVFLLLLAWVTLLLLMTSAPETVPAPEVSDAHWYIRLGRFLAVLLFPLTGPLDRILQLLEARRIRISSLAKSPREEADLEASVLEEDEEQLGDYIAEFRETDVESVMTSRMDISAIPTTATLQNAVDIIGESGHSRLPLYLDDLDHIEGFIYAKDLLPLLALGDPDTKPDWKKICRKALLVSTEQSIADLLRAFKLGTTHVALVMDEYGGTEGLVTLEDVLEELVGDIRDEFDQDEPVLWESIDPERIRFDARIDLDAFHTVIDSIFDVVGADTFDAEQFEFETLGGLVQHLTESVPESGTQVTAMGLLFTVEDVDQHRIGHVVVSAIRPESDEESNESD